MFIATSNFLIPNATLIVELVAFLVVLAFIGRYVLPYLKKALDERAALIGSQLAAADEAKADANAADAQRRAALEEARFTVTGSLGCKIQIESRVGPATIDALTKMGHEFDVRKEYTANMGRGNVVEHDSAKGMNFGGSDPRGDGAAIPEMPSGPASLR